MSPYIYELPDWQKLGFDQKKLATPLAELRHRQGRLIGRMESLGFSLQKEATLQTLTQDVIKSSEIEGEILDRDQVRSSIARRLGMDIGGLTHIERNVEGVVTMMLDATQNYSAPLTADRLFSWHASLFPGSYSGLSRIEVGKWRNDAGGPMQVVSGAIGHERVHFEAPKAEFVKKEMEAFFDWFNQPADVDLVLRAGIAHLWFVTIHPFEDGNGRIARAISDMALARSENSAQRFYSMSAQIRIERTTYYNLLERTQKNGLDITPWLEWFLSCLNRAFDGTEKTLSTVLRKARFWEVHTATPFNERQRLMLNKLFDGFDGNLTSTKWAKIAKCSPDTALRDILGLVSQGVLARNPGGGRSTSYSLSDPDVPSSGEPHRA